MLGGGDEALLLVEIEEHVEGIAHFRAFGHIALGQQNVADVATLKIYTMFFYAQDLQ